METKIYTIQIKKKVYKQVDKLPDKIMQKFFRLVQDLGDNGPLLYNWPNFSRLTDTTYHCHLSYRWVACWQCDNNQLLIEIYYAGSRENAPY